MLLMLAVIEMKLVNMPTTQEKKKDISFNYSLMNQKVNKDEESFGAWGYQDSKFQLLTSDKG